MYRKSTNGTIRFSLKAPRGTRRVQLAGDLTAWQPVDMERRPGGRFLIDLPAIADLCEYKFLIDGQWAQDPDHSDWACNPYGTVNSVARLREAALARR